MAEKRKLLAEIEKCFKKIDEGVELFEETMEKMLESNSDNQREKLQDDLKKEIKKLQRMRDLVKNWLNSTEIKDKDKLTTYRKLIESKMEQFKDIERDHKIKPHSKLGLCAEEKLDPKEKARHECVEWLNNTIRGLNDENDKLEASLELLSSGDNGRRRGKGKEDPEKVEKEKELNTLLEAVKFHIDRLELTMRLVDNESLDPKEVEEALKEEMDQLFRQMEEEGTLYECEGAYDELDLDSYAVTFGKNPSLDDHDESYNGHISSGHSSRHPSTDVPPSPAPVKRAPSTSSTHHTPLKITDYSPSSAVISSIPPPLVSTSAPSTPPPPPPPVIPYNSIAAGAARSTDSTPASVGGKSVAIPSLSVADSPSVDGSVTGPASPSVESPSLAPLSSSSPIVLSSILPLSLPPLSITIPPPSTPPPIAPAPLFSSPPLSSSSTIVDEEHCSVSEGTIKDENGVPSPPEPPTQSGIETKNTVEDMRSQTDVSSFNNDDLRSFLRMTQPEPKIVEHQTAHIPAYLGASPLGREPPTEDYDKYLSALEMAQQRIPHQMDSERPRAYLPQMPCATPSFYPQQAPPNSDSMEYYLKLSPETLFFTFYYMEGSRAQLLAAMALKKLSWRFHTKYLMWFQRHEAPKQITDDFEEGSYIYFDYEKWSQRKKEPFRFEYRYLEDCELE